jgi:HSP20 family protein
MNQESTQHCPETPVDKLREVVAGLIDAVATQGGKAIDSLGLRTAGRSWLPNIDVIEENEYVVVAVDVPGVDPNEVEILLAGNMLTVKGRVPGFERTPKEMVHRRERPAGTFSRSIPLPVAVNSEQVNADARHGVLTIRLAKADRVKARQIPVGTAT